MFAKDGKDAVNRGISKIKEDYNLELETPEATAKMWEIMQERIWTQVEQVLKRADQKVKRLEQERTKSGNNSSDEQQKVKKSHRPNYYAYFHSCCGKKRSDPGPLNDVELKYQWGVPVSDTIKPDGQKKQNDYKLMIESGELANSFKEYTGSLGETADFITEHLPDHFGPTMQMERTALIWWRFLTEEQRESFKSWYKTKDNKVHTKVVLHPKKLYKADTDPNSRSQSEAEDDSPSVVSDHSDVESEHDEPPPKAALKPLKLNTNTNTNKAVSNENQFTIKVKGFAQMQAKPKSGKTAIRKH